MELNSLLGTVRFYFSKGRPYVKEYIYAGVLTLSGIYGTFHKDCIFLTPGRRPEKGRF